MSRRNPVSLSRYFTDADFAVSSSYPDLVRDIPAAYLSKVRNLATLLDGAQGWLDRAYPSAYRIQITSGYRPAALNTRVGAVATSLHTTADAADFIIVDRATGRAVPELLALLWSGYLIPQFGGRGIVGEVELTTRHIHITNPVGRNVDEWMVKADVPIKTFTAPPSPAQTAAVVAALAGVLALSQL